MITAPQIDELKLKEVLENLHDIHISRMTFVPRGETSWGYKIETKDKSYFLKLYKNKPEFLEPI